MNLPKILAIFTFCTAMEVLIPFDFCWAAPRTPASPILAWPGNGRKRLGSATETSVV